MVVNRANRWHIENSKIKLHSIIFQNYLIKLDILIIRRKFSRFYIDE